MWCSVILYGAKLIACVTQLCPHLAEKCKLRIKTKHGKIYLGKTTDFRWAEYIQREHWYKWNLYFVGTFKNQIYVLFERQMCWFYIAQPLSRKTCYHDLLWFLGWRMTFQHRGIFPFKDFKRCARIQNDICYRVADINRSDYWTIVSIILHFNLSWNRYS